jgi:hypothetical protein
MLQRPKNLLASRPDPLFGDAFSKVLNVRMHVVNKEGICAFASRTLKDVFLRSSSDETNFAAIPAEVADLSQGVFLRARFAVFEVIKA